MLDKQHPGMKPGVHLRREIERLNLDQVAVAEATGVSRQTINNIVNGRQDISRAMAARLGRLTGRSSDYWLQSSFLAIDDQAEIPDTQAAEKSFAEKDKARPLGVGVLVNHQLKRAVADGTIGIEPFDPDQVHLASLDLTLDDFVLTTEGAQIDVSDGFLLKGGQTISARSKEWIEFPVDYFARVGAMTALAKFGIATTHGFQVDPGFRGNLQFCLSNLGGKNFELRSGMPVISLEIMPLSATPAYDERAASHVRVASNREAVFSHFHNDVCDGLIRDAVRAQTKLETLQEGTSAKIPDLEAEVIEATADAALKGAVDSALSYLKSLRARPTIEVALREKYAAFFGELANRLHLSAGQARSALSCLGMQMDDEDSPIVTLHDGASTVLQLPLNSARISLRHLARQLKEDPSDLVLVLCGLTGYGSRPTSRLT